MMQLSPGQVLGRYELLLPVARGGMAEVWAARLHGSRGFRKTVAVKTILPGTIDGSRLEKMFLAEAELASRIAHPNVAQTLELGEHEGILYLVLEWVEGESLASIINQAEAHGGVPLAVGVNIVGQACKGLHAAHELTDDHGQPLHVVHRDISPDNIMIGYDGFARVLDFGVAHALGQLQYTATGELKGKVRYAAPEQIDGGGLDRRTDVWGLGVVLWEALTGEVLFPQRNLRDVLMAVTGAPIPGIRERVPGLPLALDEIVAKALARDPDRRFASARELSRALDGYLSGVKTHFTVAEVADQMTRLFDDMRRRRLVQIGGARGLVAAPGK
jgi:serine/threonine-protein kinase